MKYTKDRQWVFDINKEPGRYFPAKLIQIGRIKIHTYPQEIGNDTPFSKELYDGKLFTITIRRPKLMLKGELHLSFGLNDKKTKNLLKRRHRKAKITKVPIDNKESIESLVDKSLKEATKRTKKVIKKKNQRSFKL